MSATSTEQRKLLESWNYLIDEWRRDCRGLLISPKRHVARVAAERMLTNYGMALPHLVARGW